MEPCPPLRYEPIVHAWVVDNATNATNATAATTILLEQGPCVAGYVHADGSCYTIFPLEVNATTGLRELPGSGVIVEDHWAAEAQCARNWTGASLAKISSTAQNAVLAALVGASDPLIGLEWNGNWYYWRDGTPMAYYPSWELPCHDASCSKTCVRLLGSHVNASWDATACFSGFDVFACSYDVISPPVPPPAAPPPAGVAAPPPPQAPEPLPPAPPGSGEVGSGADGGDVSSGSGPEPPPPSPPSPPSLPAPPSPPRCDVAHCQAKVRCLSPSPTLNTLVLRSTALRPALTATPGRRPQLGDHVQS
jgi:hypothetical protein